MPKSVSAEFARAWADVSQRFAAYEVIYKRRYYDSGSPGSMVYESVAHTLYPSDIEDITPIHWKGDESLGGEYLAANVSIFLRNDGQKWLPSNVIDSIWKPDATAELGYEPYLSWWQIKYGYRKADGTFELVAVFTGYSEVPYFDSGSGRVEIRLVGREIVLQKTDAQRISTSYTGQSATLVSGKTYTTGKKSLWDVSAVYDGATQLTQGSDGDYTLENTNDADSECLIVLNDSYTPSGAITWDGRQWPHDVKVSDLVGLLCDEAGIGSGERIIEEPNWPDVGASVVVDSEADWNAATKNGTDDEQSPGDIVLGTLLTNRTFETGDFTGWSQASSSLSGTGDSIVQGSVVHSGSYAAVVRVATSEPPPSGAFEIRAALVHKTTGLAIATTDLGTSEVDWTEGTLDVGAGVPLDQYYLQFRVYWNATLYSQINSVAKVEGIQTVKFWYKIVSPLGIGMRRWLYVDDVVAHSLPASGTVLTAELDLLAAPTAWGQLVVDGTLNDGSWSWKTQVASSPGGPYDSLVSVAGDYTIQSALKRYLKIEGTLNRNAVGNNGPLVSKLTANYFGSSLFIAQGDVGGQDAYQAISDLAKWAGMDFGFLGDGTLFFQNRVQTTTPDFVLTESNVLSKISNMDPGYKDIKNDIQVRYQGYYSEWNSTKEGEAEPSSQTLYGDNVETIDLSRFAFSNNAQVAEAVAKKRYREKSAPRRSFKATGRIIPHMNQRDVAEVSFSRTPLLRVVSWLDPMQTEPPMTDDPRGPSNVLLQKGIAKVAGISYHIPSATQETDFLEVLES